MDNISDDNQGCIQHGKPWIHYCSVCSCYHCPSCKCCGEATHKIDVAQIVETRACPGDTALENLLKASEEALAFYSWCVGEMDMSVELRSKCFKTLRSLVVNWQKVSEADTDLAGRLLAELSQIIQRSHTNTLRSLNHRFFKLLNISVWLREERKLMMKRINTLKTLVVDEKKLRLRYQSRLQIIEKFVELVSEGVEFKDGKHNLTLYPLLFDSHLATDIKPKIHTSVGEYSAFDNAYMHCTQLFIGEHDLTNIASELFMTTHIPIKQRILRPTTIYSSTVSHKGILSVCYKKRKLVTCHETDRIERKFSIKLKLLDLNTTNTAKLRDCACPTTAVFYDDKILLLCYRLGIMEGNIDEFMIKPSWHLFSSLGNAYQPDHRTDATLVHKTRQLLFVNHPHGQIKRYDVDTKVITPFVGVGLQFHSIVTTFGLTTGFDFIYLDASGKMKGVKVHEFGDGFVDCSDWNTDGGDRVGNNQNGVGGVGINTGGESFISGTMLRQEGRWNGIIPPADGLGKLDRQYKITSLDQDVSISVDRVFYNPFPGVSNTLVIASMVRIYRDAFISYDYTSNSWGLFRLFTKTE